MLRTAGSRFTRSFHPTNVRQFASINFNDSKESFKSKSMAELLRGYFVFSLCQTPIIVKNSEKLMNASYKMLGTRLTDFALKHTMFGHFCAGEDADLIKPTVQYLNKNGVGAILDYASEADVKEEPTHAKADYEVAAQPYVNPMQNLMQARTYDYRDEELCDLRMDIFDKCIRAVHAVSPTGFAAIKLTALGNPKLLETVSTAVVERRKLFLKFDTENKESFSQDHFRKQYDQYFSGGRPEDAIQVMGLKEGQNVDYISWCHAFPIEELHLVTQHCRQKGPLASATLDENELKLFEAMKGRIRKLVVLASSLNVRLMIDAEHSYFQPVIDLLTMQLAREFNKTYPVIFGTYQMYLKDSMSRLKRDIERARQGDYIFAAKLVRGAYMVLERARAELLNTEDPINVNIETTHDNYNAGARYVLEKIAEGQKTGVKLEMMLASHNQSSVEQAIAHMDKLGLPPSSGVYFGQLLGMSDHLSFSLGHKGYKAYKYVPYGKIQEVMPYLIRRAQENSDALGGAAKEITMIKSEIWRRITGK